MPRMISAVLLALVGASASIVAAQDAPIRLGGVQPETKSVAIVQKADLIASYLRLDHEVVARDALAAGDPNRVSAAFDEATAAFFAGAMNAALGNLDSQTASLRLRNDALPQHIIAMSFQTRIDPPVWRAGLPEPRLTVSPLYEIRFDKTHYDDPRIRFAVVDPHGAAVAEHDVTVSEGAQWPQTVDLFNGAMPGDLRPGVYTITARWTEGRQEPFEVGRWQVAARSMDGVREVNEARLNIIEQAEPELAQAIAMTRSRNALLCDSPSPEQAAQWLADQTALAESVDAELASLEQGLNPFVGRTGDWWCRLPANGVDLPLRVYIPESLPDGPVPLVIAIHGMGGDENMFMDGYGAGAIKRLADERGFIVASPEAANMAYPASFDALVEAVNAWRSVDPSRIYVVGHSMGAGLAATLAAARPDRIAGVAMIAGGGGFPPAGKPMPPTLVIGAETDNLVRPSMLEDMANAARERGLPVEGRTIPGVGHTMVVNLALPEVIDGWMPAP